ncbi:MFS transporter [Pseudonocardia xishanensis]|uniref:MFS transporter n=1 Tax=Pseudonocardia xishanensis TaxID=630995 RepID=A0ABP8RXS6_9PSEU
MSVSTSDPDFRVRRRRAILSAWAGFAVDSYSIYIVSSVLLPALVYFQGDISAEGKAIFAGLTLATTLLGRPLGGIIFGHFADKIGRARVGSVTIYGFGTISLLIACLPGAELIGAVPAMGLLLFLRFVEGIFLGGEYTAATPMALEYAPPARRGLVGAVIQCSASGGPLLVAAAMAVVLLIAPSGDINSPYVQWGWRLPFVLGFVMSFVIAWFLRRKVEESTIQQEVRAQEGEHTTSALRRVLKGKSGRAFVQAWVIMTGIFFTVNLTGSVLNQFLLGNEGFTPADLANTQLIVSVFGMASYIVAGFFSDKIGRKNVLFIVMGASLVCYPILISVIGSNVGFGWGTLTLLAIGIHILNAAPLGVLPAYINERFATSVRSTGWGVAYSTAVIIPAFFSYYMVWLSALVPFAWTAGILAVLGAVIVLAATAAGPETKGIDLRVAGTDDDQAPAGGTVGSEPSVASGT